MACFTRRFAAPTLTLLVLMASTVAAEEPPKRQYFSITVNDNLIGYAVVGGHSDQLDGQPAQRVESTTALKISMLGTERNILLDSVTFLSPDGQPIRYRLLSKTNDVVQVVETEFELGGARTWSYREGDDRGTGVETELPPGAVVLGSNNFAHWGRMIQAAASQASEAGKASIAAFVPEVGQITRFEFVRGEPKDLEVAGGTRSCIPWTLAAEQVVAWTDSQTGEFVRLDLASQKTVIELTDASVARLAEKSRAEEVLANHFAKSNVRFDDFLQVTSLTAEVDVKVIGEGIQNDASVLDTSIQQFQGLKNADHVKGVISITSAAYAGEDSPPFPTTSPDESLAKWLKPSLHIESDHEPIRKKSEELCSGAATRWEAVRRIGDWVYKEIAYTIADTPSARLAFETRKGDCGPHSTLMVSMLQAAGIPARLVGGVVYTPTFGGTFGQHAWVEVHMGPAGWVAMDPTTGEFEKLSATHIKLFEGMGGVLPASIQVTSFDPPNRATTPASATETKPLSWKLDAKHVFRYLQGEQEIGRETVSITKVEMDGRDTYQVKSDLTLQAGGGLKSDATLTTKLNAHPLLFDRNFAVSGKNVNVRGQFGDGSVKAVISGDQNLSQDIDLPADAYCFDNNMMATFVMICSQLELEPNKAVTVQTFHPSSLQIIALTFTPKPLAEATIAGKSIECYECSVAPIQNTFWISKDGRFLKAQQGPLVMELMTLE